MALCHVVADNALLLKKNFKKSANVIYLRGASINCLSLRICRPKSNIKKKGIECFWKQGEASHSIFFGEEQTKKNNKEATRDFPVLSSSPNMNMLLPCFTSVTTSLRHQEVAVSLGEK